jgi:hypothetical protein
VIAESTDLPPSSGASSSAAPVPQSAPPSSSFVFNVLVSFGGTTVSVPVDVVLSLGAPYPINLGLGPDISFQLTGGGGQ